MTRFLVPVIVLVMLGATSASAQVTISPIVVLATNPHDVRVEDGIVRIVFASGEDGWTMPAEAVAQMCATEGRQFRLAGVPLAGGELVIHITSGRLHVGSVSVEYQCPLPPEFQRLRALLASDMPRRGWTNEVQTAVLAAIDSRNVRVETIAVGTSGLPWYGPRFESPYAPRWSEGNLASHFRDEYFGREVEVYVITAGGRRYTVLLDDCGGIEKVSVGVIPTVTTRRPAQPQPPRVVRTPRVPQPLELGDLPTIRCVDPCRRN
jgi:hypothetical protein